MRAFGKAVLSALILIKGMSDFHGLQLLQFSLVPVLKQLWWCLPSLAWRPSFMVLGGWAAPWCRAPSFWRSLLDVLLQWDMSQLASWSPASNDHPLWSPWSCDQGDWQHFAAGASACQELQYLQGRNKVDSGKVGSHFQKLNIKWTSFGLPCGQRVVVLNSSFVCLYLKVLIATQGKMFCHSCRKARPPSK